MTLLPLFSLQLLLGGLPSASGACLPHTDPVPPSLGPDAERVRDALWGAWQSSGRSAEDWQTLDCRDGPLPVVYALDRMRHGFVITRQQGGEFILIRAEANGFVVSDTLSEASGRRMGAEFVGWLADEGMITLETAERSPCAGDCIAEAVRDLFSREEGFPYAASIRTQWDLGAYFEGVLPVDARAGDLAFVSGCPGVAAVLNRERILVLLPGRRWTLRSAANPKQLHGRLTEACDGQAATEGLLTVVRPEPAAARAVLPSTREIDEAQAAEPDLFAATAALPFVDPPPPERRRGWAVRLEFTGNPSLLVGEPDLTDLASPPAGLSAVLSPCFGARDQGAFAVYFCAGGGAVYRPRHAAPVSGTMLIAAEFQVRALRAAIPYLSAGAAVDVLGIQGVPVHHTSGYVHLGVDLPFGEGILPRLGPQVSVFAGPEFSRRFLCPEGVGPACNDYVLATDEGADLDLDGWSEWAPSARLGLGIGFNPKGGR